MIKTSWEGNCFLNFFNNKASLGNVDKTIFKSKSTSPYKLLKSTHDQDGRCILPILHTAGGLVGGDLLEFEVNLEKDSKVLLTTSSAQKVYGSVGRSKINPKGTFSKQKNLINILDNSHLEYLPQETIIFANGLFEQNFKVNISEQKYLKMVKSRYISCLLDLKSNEISKGISELKSKYKYQIKFTDTLKCISYKR